MTSFPRLLQNFHFLRDQTMSSTKLSSFVLNLKRDTGQETGLHMAGFRFAPVSGLIDLNPGNIGRAMSWNDFEYSHALNLFLTLHECMRSTPSFNEKDSSRQII